MSDEIIIIGWLIVLFIVVVGIAWMIDD